MEQFYKGFFIYGDNICSLADINGMLSGVYEGLDTAKYLIDKTEGKQVDMFKLTEKLQQDANLTELQLVTIEIIDNNIN